MKAFASFVIAISLFALVRPAAAIELPPADNAGPPISFYANLTADDESSVTESPGTGRVDFTLDRQTLRLSWKGTFGNLPPNSKATSIAIHGPQTIGGEAGVLFELSAGGAKSPFEGSAVLTDAQLEYLVTGRFYVNLHSTKYPAGELRGTVKRLPPKDNNLTQ